MSIQRTIFNDLKQLVTGVTNTDDEQIFQQFLIYREEQVQDPKMDSPHAFPYVTLDFNEIEREANGKYQQTIMMTITIRLHLLSTDYDKLEMYDAVDALMSILNWYSVEVDTDILSPMTCIMEGDAEKFEQEVVYPMEFEIAAFTQKDCPYGVLLPYEYDVALRVTGEEEQYIPTDTGENGTSWLDLTGDQGIIYE